MTSTQLEPVKKFSSNFDNLVDTSRLDLGNIRSWLVSWLEKYKWDDREFITDFIMDYLEEEQYPDAKTMQCELADNFLPLKQAQDLMGRIWKELLYKQKNSSSSISPSAPSYSHSSHGSRSSHHHYNSYHQSSSHHYPSSSYSSRQYQSSSSYDSESCYSSSKRHRAA